MSKRRQVLESLIDALKLAAGVTLAIFNEILLRVASLFALLSIALFIPLSVIYGMNEYTASALLFLYMILSPIAIYIYWVDKSAAKAGTWRIPEASLHLLELAGGFVGALAAQKLLRHKTVKKSYQAVFALIALYHTYLWVAFFLFNGQYVWFSLFLSIPALSSLQRN